jgi:inhibitor of KinA sporulation pathway (predicted exonuclease)
MTAEIIRTPEETHAYALGDFCNHLQGIRAKAQKGIDAAHEIVRRLEELAKLVPSHNPIPEMSPADEAALLEATRANLSSLGWERLWDDLHCELNRARDSASEACGHLDEAQGFQRYLAAGDFSE